MQENGFDHSHWDYDHRGGGFSELQEYWRAIRPCWRRITLCALAAAVVTSLLTVFVMPRWYKASAVLRPASQESASQQAVSVGASGILSSLGSVGSALGLGNNDNDAQEFMVIMGSNEFTLNLVKRHQLKYHILSPGRLRRIQQHFGIDPYSPWRQFVKMQALFDMEYDSQAGNLTITFRDRDRAMANKILNYYIDDLRVLLRRHAVEVAAIAVNSLNDQIGKTSDALLQQQLDQLVAQQLQAELTAEMQADFAFTVDDPPSTPELPDSPWFYLDPLVAALLTPFLAVLYLISRQRINLADVSERPGAAPEPSNGQMPLEDGITAEAPLQHVHHR
jgi:hypothetical protein